MVQRLDLEDAALKPALLAFCLARIGVGHNDQALSEQAIRLYGTALKEMNLALRNGSRIHTDETLAAGKLMAHYEVWVAAKGMCSYRRVDNGRCSMDLPRPS